MSYSALTELGTKPICPLCKGKILPFADVAVVLVTTADFVPNYNEENELEAGTLLAGLDWTRQEAFHVSCLETVTQIDLTGEA